MKPRNIQQEIVVFTETSFAQKTLLEKRGSDERTSPAEELEKAFWNGMLNEMLPELMLPIRSKRQEFYIWKISTGESSLLIDVAETPNLVKDSHSINPYLFITALKKN